MKLSNIARPVFLGLAAIGVAALVAGGQWASDRAGLAVSEYLGVYEPADQPAAETALIPD